MSDYRALYRKWRPVDFDDVSGQKAITDILKYEVANNKISHAYLFCGSRGTGKTSCAKILAKAVNCENSKNGNPCNECYACRSIDSGIATDVIEMDAASNNGIGNVRDMKDEISFTPAELKYRVYIIDEVHMMSGPAFNALLKTLEEPPAYVVFILATTEFNKLPTTIVSRCQRFDFKRMSTEVIVKRLSKIADSEGIELTKDGAAMIARAAEGGMRDAVSLLELCAGSRMPITAELVFNTVGRGNKGAAYTVVESILAQDYSKIYSAIADIAMSGSDITVFWQDLIDAYRDIIVIKSCKEASSYLDLTDSEQQRLCEIAKGFTLQRLLYHSSVLESTLSDLQRVKESKRSVAEIALTKMCDPRLETTPQALLSRIEELESQVSRLKYGASGAQKEVAVKEEMPKTVKEAVPAAEKTEPTAKADTAEESIAFETYYGWENIVSGIERTKKSIYSPLSKAVAKRSGENLFLIKIDPFFVKIISGNPENTAILKGLIGEAENIDADKIDIKILPKDKDEVPTLSDEIENALK